MDIYVGHLNDDLNDVALPTHHIFRKIWWVDSPTSFGSIGVDILYAHFIYIW